MLVTNALRTLFQLAHFEERHQEGKRRFRSLVLIGAVRVQAVAASTGAGIVERNLQVVISQKPIESGPRLFPPAAPSRCKIRLKTCRNYRAGLDGLLVETSLFGFLRVEALRSD